MTPAELRQLLRYDPDAGLLYWKPRGVKRWDTRCAGKVALTARQGEGYPHGSIKGRHYLAHRVAWAVHYGEWPEHEIDHINGDRADYRISNLRAATRAQNSLNKRVAGVSQKRDGMWQAYIHVGGKMRHLGMYATRDAAASVRREAEVRHFGEFARQVA